MRPRDRDTIGSPRPRSVREGLDSALKKRLRRTARGWVEKWFTRLPATE